MVLHRARWHNLPSTTHTATDKTFICCCSLTNNPNASWSVVGAVFSVDLYIWFRFCVCPQASCLGGGSAKHCNKPHALTCRPQAEDVGSKSWQWGCRKAAALTVAVIDLLFLFLSALSFHFLFHIDHKSPLCSSSRCPAGVLPSTWSLFLLQTISASKGPHMDPVLLGFYCPL